jgi:hypothetical protein
MVRDFIRSCSVCQWNKTKLVTCTWSAFSTLYIPHSVWADIAMDFVEGFPKVGGKMVVDCFSKYSHFIALHHLYTTLTVSHVFFDQVVRLHIAA